MQQRVYIKRNSLNRIDLIDKSGGTLHQITELKLSESLGIWDVVALDLLLPPGWTAKTEYWIKDEKIVSNTDLSNAIDDSGYQRSEIFWKVYDDRDRERLRTVFIQPYRNHSTLSVTPEFDINFNIYNLETKKSLPPQLMVWGVVERSATQEEIEKYRNSWSVLNRY